MLQTSTIQFLKQLKKNNTKEWFDKNRYVYEEAKKDFAGFIQQVIDTHAKKDKSITHLVAKDCMFRINRDVRFSKDKSPYKTNMGASINSKGKKAQTAGYYFHLEPGACFVGGGLYMPMPPDLNKIRQEIDYNFKDFKKIITAKKFVDSYGDLSHDAAYTLSRVPKGYETDNPAADYLKLKSFVATVQLDDKMLTGNNLLKETVNHFAALKPLIEFLNHALE